MNKLLIVGLLLAATSGCVHKLPLVSHAHMGHTLTTWHDTPDQEGLFVVAQKEAAVALHEAELAFLALGDEREVKLHAQNVINALNPDLQPLGPGFGYGAIRALEGAVDHLEFAASSEDASDNMVRSVANISALGDQLVFHLTEAMATAHGLHGSSRGELRPRTLTLRRQLARAVVGDTASTMGLRQLDGELNAMLARETNPPYEPVPRRYVLGLVKLPTGDWGFRLPRRSRRGHAHQGMPGAYGSGY